MTKQDTKIESKLPKFNKLLKDPVFSSSRPYKGTVDNGTCVSMWCTGYSKPGRQVLFHLLWNIAYAKVGEKRPDGTIVSGYSGKSLLPKEHFEVILEIDNNIKYDAYAVQVLVLSHIAPSDIVNNAPALLSRPTGAMLHDLYSDAYRGTREDKYAYSLGYIPRERNISHVIRRYIKDLGIPLVTRMSNRAPMKDGSQKYSIYITIPYGSVINVDGELIKINTDNPEYKEIADILEFL